MESTRTPNADRTRHRFIPGVSTMRKLGPDVNFRSQGIPTRLSKPFTIEADGALIQPVQFIATVERCTVQTRTLVQFVVHQAVRSERPYTPVYRGRTGSWSHSFVVDGDLREALSPTTPNSRHHPAPRATGVERLHRSLGCLAS